ncbi:MAG: S-layer homology domain-containing protein, partial [Clostridiales bacterium]|nr:S-layer homology domain-containing protein [Clostridiales bacterium]
MLQLKKFLSTTVAFALILGLVPAIIADAAQTTDPNHWSNEAVQHAIDRGYFTGDENGNVAPDKDMTRAEFTTMVTRMQGIQPFGVSPFSDVEDGAWYRPYIAAAYYKNIITGLSETTFAPNAIINRQEA